MGGVGGNSVLIAGMTGDAPLRIYAISLLQVVFDEMGSTVQVVEVKGSTSAALEARTDKRRRRLKRPACIKMGFKTLIHTRKW